MRDRITIMKEASGIWAAYFEGPQAKRIKKLFGDTLIPTPYRLSVPGSVVLTKIQAKNPDCEVVLGDA